MGRRISENSLSLEDCDTAPGERSHGTAGQEPSGVALGGLGLVFVWEIISVILYKVDFPWRCPRSSWMWHSVLSLGDKVGISQR